MTEINWEKYNSTQLSFGIGWGVRAICQKCGTRQRVRLQRGAKVSLASCIQCGNQSLKKAVIGNEGNVENDPLAKEKTS